ncbi:MAG: tyrosine-type recombinase/integrase, partial [Bdellovibrionales bacterium]|nr:tyrosine-type recombinase/integrase [Bdellovibrionales bacterium]
GFIRHLSQIHSGLYLFIKSTDLKQNNSQIVKLGIKDSKPENLSKLIQHLLYEASGPWGRLGIKTRNRKYSCLKSFFNYLYSHKKTDINWAHKVTSPKPQQKIPRFLSFDEIQSLIIAAKREFEQTQDPRPYILLLLLYGGGLRINEACQLKLKELKAEKLIVLGKGGKQRVVVLPEAITTTLSELLNKMEADTYIWGSKPLHTQQAYRMIVGLGKKAQLLKPITPHALRHSYATHMLSSGMNLRALQKILGHSSLKATEKYLHLSLDQLSDTLSKNHPLNNKTEES